MASLVGALRSIFTVFYRSESPRIKKVNYLVCTALVRGTLIKLHTREYEYQLTVVDPVEGIVTLEGGDIHHRCLAIVKGPILEPGGSIGDFATITTGSCVLFSLKDARGFQPTRLTQPIEEIEVHRVAA